MAPFWETYGVHNNGPNATAPAFLEGYKIGVLSAQDEATVHRVPALSAIGHAQCVRPFSGCVLDAGRTDERQSTRHSDRERCKVCCVSHPTGTVQVKISSGGERRT